MSKTLKNCQKGMILIQALVFAVIVIATGTIILEYLTTQHKATRVDRDYEKVLDIAEAGINHYKWVLSHNPEDYWDGQGEGSAGPYIHDFEDLSGVIGQYSIEIDPPEVGSSTITVRSTGYLNSNPNRQRTIEAKFGIPTLADYIFLLNSNVNFSATTSVSGKVHSNGGIRFDGACDSIISSAKETYNYSGQTKPGVWRSEGLPETCPPSFWEFPVASINFDEVSADLSQIKSDAQAEGRYYARSDSNLGYHIVFNPDGTFNIYEVTGVRFFSPKRLTIRNESLIGTFPIPDNGLIFVEDRVWVNGTVSGRVTLASARFPEHSSTYTDIVIHDDITFQTGRDVDSLGLIAQRHVEVPSYSPEDLEIEGALLAQHGAVYRDYYLGNTRDSLSIIGGIISNQQSGFKYGSPPNYSSGYVNTYYEYNAEMIFSPPPSFPSITGGYEMLSWQEIET